MNKICKYCGDEILTKMPGLVCNTCKNGLNRYGMNKLDQQKMLLEQENKCKICTKVINLNNKYAGAYIDHCHKTNKVRGILCFTCNTTVGLVENNNLPISRLTQYLG